MRKGLEKMEQPESTQRWVPASSTCLHPGGAGSPQLPAKQFYFALNSFVEEDSAAAPPWIPALRFSVALCLSVELLKASLPVQVRRRSGPEDSEFPKSRMSVSQNGLLSTSTSPECCRMFPGRLSNPPQTT